MTPNPTLSEPSNIPTQPPAPLASHQIAISLNPSNNAANPPTFTNVPTAARPLLCFFPSLLLPLLFLDDDR